MPDKKKVMKFFMNLKFGQCFENTYASTKEERIRVFLGMVVNQKKQPVGISVCSPTKKHPVEIHYKLNQINPQKTQEVPIYEDHKYEEIFQKAL